MTARQLVGSDCTDQGSLPTSIIAGTGLGEGFVPAVALIPLRNRRGDVIAFALIDAEDFPRLSQWRWSFDYRGYAIRATSTSGKQRSIRMHREVLDAQGDPRDVDHINRNRLDNRKANLRLVTRAVNLANKSAIQDELPQSGVRGVRWDAQQQRWAAFAGSGQSRRRVGSYATVDEAVDAIAAALAGAR